MELLTIGAFAKASRLSPKALRLYDELGLLEPVHVDPSTGYRHYAPAQLERARLVAWLRRLGMPLARIRQVCVLAEGPEAGSDTGSDAGPGAAAQEVRAYWARVETETAARRDLAAFLVDHLSRKDTAVNPNSPNSPNNQDSPGNTPPMEIRYAALSDPGLVRESNQDTAYAGSRLLAVADGYGPAGAPASAAAVEALKRLETDGVPAGGLLNALEDAVEEAGRAVHDATATATASGGRGQEQGPHGAGTTLTAMLWTGSQLALVHIGDTRAHLLRDGELFQITHDHTLVQAMADEGRISADEAASHPQRALLARALARDADSTPDLRLHEARPGDRYLLCSDGLSAVVPADEIRRVVTTVRDPGAAVRELVALARDSGGPDNVSCVVADVRERSAAETSAG
ncbi:MerR family transcriptional regulator [Streptomyces daliensis]|uniref:MerR family transcriptional regulator n=1 Tax=Streptomyces daliensis TaxID=299421 RepID=A0A8T4IZA1_9ACTN|nr:MerR family transcriptional regulator [Streptomyces daliensis]